MKTSLALAFLMFNVCADAQTGLFHFTSPQTQQSLQEAATIVRTVADATQVSTDSSTATLTFEAPPAQIAMAEWILGTLDAPAVEGASPEYKSPSGDDVVRVNFLANVSSAQQMQEILTVLRTVADVQKIFNFTARQALVIRAKSANLNFAEWIIDQLNLPADQKLDASPRVYPATMPFNSVARVNYLTNISSARGTQELLTVLRTVGTIAKVFNYTSTHALVLRAPEADIERAEWLILELNQATAPQNAGTQIYETPGADDVTRVFFLTNATDKQLSAAMTAIRAETKSTRVFMMSTPAAVIVRGTADQIEAAVQAMAQRNGLAMLRR